MVMMLDLMTAATTSSGRRYIASSVTSRNSSSDMPKWTARHWRRRSLDQRTPASTTPQHRGRSGRRVPMSFLLLATVMMFVFQCYCFDKVSSEALEQRRPAVAVDVVRRTANNAPWRNGIKNGLASAGAAACVKILLQPIDAIKTVQQYESSSVTLWSAFEQLYHRKQLYAGLTVTVLGSMPSVALYFGVYSYCKQRLLQHTQWGKRHPTTSIALSAAIGNSVASFSRVPYETVKQKLQAGIYDTTWSVLTDLRHRPGLARELLFPAGGVWVQMLRDIPYAVVTLLLYESLQQRFHHLKDNRTMTTTTTTIESKNNNSKSKGVDFVLGGIAGGVGSWVTNPMDVIKTRIQTGTSTSIINCVGEVWREGGLDAMFRGSVPRLLHKVPANACFFLFYETFKRLLHVQGGGATGTKLVSSASSSEEEGKDKAASSSAPVANTTSNGSSNR